jgi:hypothetical protein
VTDAFQAAARLGQASALDHSKKDDHDRQNQQNVDEPPIVVDVTIPSSHRTTRMRAIA